MEDPKHFLPSSLLSFSSRDISHKAFLLRAVYFGLACRKCFHLTDLLSGSIFYCFFPFGCAWGNLFFLTGLFPCQVLVLKGWGVAFDLMPGKCICFLVPSWDWEGGRDGKGEETATSSACLATAFSSCVCFTLAFLPLSPPAECCRWSCRTPSADKVPDVSLYILSGASLILAGNRYRHG